MDDDHDDDEKEIASEKETNGAQVGPLRNGQTGSCRTHKYGTERKLSSLLEKWPPI